LPSIIPLLLALALVIAAAKMGGWLSNPGSDLKVPSPVGVKIIPLSDTECLHAIQVGRQEFDVF
jgi:hypothetical protein